MSPPVSRPSDRSILIEASVRFATAHVLLAACLFASAGTFVWPMAWAYLALSLIVTSVTLGLLIKYDPALMWERMRWHKDAKSWDKIFVPLIAALLPLITLIVAGFDRRLAWSPDIPIAAQIIALIALLPCYAGLIWAMLANTFFSAYVRIQSERGHTVITTGPYAIVRHPGYVAAILADIALPIALGTLWGLIPMGIVILLLILRTELEDRTLKRELDGYADYATRVRYRLLPGVW